MATQTGDFSNTHPTSSALPSKTSKRVGLGLGGLATLFLAFDITIKLMASPESLAGTQELGYPATVVFPLGILQTVLLALYLFPRTSILGAVLWTGSRHLFSRPCNGQLTPTLSEPTGCRKWDVLGGCLDDLRSPH